MELEDTLNDLRELVTNLELEVALDWRWSRLSPEELAYFAARADEARKLATVIQLAVTPYVSSEEDA
jgi:hypothetical protein